MRPSSEDVQGFGDRRLDPERLTGAVAGLLQTKLALTGQETRLVELALCGEIHDLLAQSGWLVSDEFSADILKKGTRYKRCDLITFKTVDKTGPRSQPKDESVSYAYEVKVLNNKHRATDGFQADLLSDSARLALFGERFKNCTPVQLVVAGAGSLAAYLQDQKNLVSAHPERWAPIWGAMNAVASAATWHQLANARHYSKLKTGEHLEAFAQTLQLSSGVYGKDASQQLGSRSASFSSPMLCDGLEKTAVFDELKEYAAVLGSKTIKYDRGFVHCVQCPGQAHRFDNVGLDDYLVFTVRVRAI